MDMGLEKVIILESCSTCSNETMIGFLSKKSGQFMEYGPMTAMY